MLILIFFISQCFSHLFTTVDETSLKPMITKREFAVVIFFSGQLLALEEYFTIFDALFNKFSRNMTVGGCDFGANPDLVEHHRIRLNPEILFFKAGKFAGKYEGDWTEDALARYVSKLGVIMPKAEPISNYKKLTSAIKSAQSSVIIYDTTPDSAFFNNFIENFNFVMSSYVVTNTFFGFITDKTLAKKAGVTKFPMVQIHRPVDNLLFTFNKFPNKTKLVHKIETLIAKIHGNQLAGSSSTQKQWVLFGFAQFLNSNHLLTISKVMKHCSLLFGRSVLFQYGEFLDNYELAKIVGIKNCKNPSFIAFRSDFNQQQIYVPFLYKGRPSPLEVRIWLKSKIRLIDKIDQISSEFKTDNAIPFISSKDFRELVGYNNTDTLLLVGDPDRATRSFSSNKKYFEKYRLLCRVRDILVNSSRIEYFIYNPDSQEDEADGLVPNDLRTSADREAQILLYPAKTEGFIVLNTADGFTPFLEQLVGKLHNSFSKSTRQALSEVLPNHV